MSKWMIRTRTNHIFGPISKEKLIELIDEKSIAAEDEVCSGNGYWFFLRESDLVKKYIYSESTQDFNPVSEALNESNKRKEYSQSAESSFKKIKKESEKVITQVVSLDQLKEESE
jgi:hypothetical protein